MPSEQEGKQLVFAVPVAVFQSSSCHLHDLKMFQVPFFTVPVSISQAPVTVFINNLFTQVPKVTTQIDSVPLIRSLSGGNNRRYRAEGDGRVGAEKDDVSFSVL